MREPIFCILIPYTGKQEGSQRIEQETAAQQRTSSDFKRSDRMAGSDTQRMQSSSRFIKND